LFRHTHQNAGLTGRVMVVSGLSGKCVQRHSDERVNFGNSD
jgi:hypothetical protein